ncbi:MAG: hypothetical protein WC812_00210 [Candidatus Pacearchaeota archaeon]|jgi:transcription initiation factor TFIIE subunit alpha
MLDKLLKEVVTLTVGKQAEGVADLLNSKIYINEFVIAKKLNLTINQARNILYKISDEGLVSSVRKKDKKKGWYTYYWKFEIIKALEFLKNHLLKDMEGLKQKIKEREHTVYYICKRCNIEVNEEQALTLDFGCPECGSVFEIKDNSALIKEINKELLKLEEKMKIVDEEIGKERGQLEKKKMKELKVVEKEKQERKALAVAKRKKTRMETLKKSMPKKGKKIVKKEKPKTNKKRIISHKSKISKSKTKSKKPVKKIKKK